MTRNSTQEEFTLAKKPSGRHYEVHVKDTDADGLLEAVKAAFTGTLDNHQPKPGHRYSSRIYSRHNFIIVKLTTRWKRV